MWPIEFIKRLVQRVLRGEVSLPERIYDLARRGIMSTFDSPRSRENSTITTPQQNAAVSVVPVNKISLGIELPITSRNPHPRRFTITIPKDMSVGRLRTKLAEKFEVKNEDWRIVAIDDKNAQRILDDKEKLNEIKPEKRRRIYFYPNILR